MDINNNQLEQDRKAKGMKEYLDWRCGNMRGHHKLGKAIIEKYGIQKEVEDLKKERQRAYQREYKKNFRLFNPDLVRARENRYYLDNKEALDEYAKLPKTKEQRRRREEIKRKLYAELLQRERQNRWLD